MIFYFTGTGNSLWVAKKISESLQEPMVSMSKELDFGKNIPKIQMKEVERIIFVFPVHSWGVPVLVREFVEKMQLEGYNGQPIDLVCTCGDECGKTTQLFQKILCKRGLKLSNSYSIQMPNNYTLLPGFDVDSPEVEQSKIVASPALLEDIIESLKNYKLGYYYTGSWAALKSYLIYPLFRKYALSTKPFYSTESCTSCGLCEKSCPTGTITMNGGKPAWSKGCVQCLACLNRCPVRAIEYGKVTLKKGRYKHPELKSTDK